jgi:hypothetical protein
MNTSARGKPAKCVTNEIAVTQATGRANSIRAEAQAQADATTLRGNAEASAIKAKGDALAANPNLVALIQAERWNGVLPTTLVPGSAVRSSTCSTRQSPDAPVHSSIGRSLFRENLVKFDSMGVPRMSLV